MDLSIKSYNNRDIRINPNTRYVCLTDMATANGKKTNDWMRLDSTTEYLAAFELATGIPVSELLFVGEGTIGTWAHPKIAIRFAQWCSIGFAIQVDGWIDELLTNGVVEVSPTIEQDRQWLEVSAAPKPKLSEIKQAGKIYCGVFGKAYEQRYIQQQVEKHYPALAGFNPLVAEQVSLPTAKALLTPTQIAKELGLFCKTKPENPSPQKVNKLLERLGYQTKVAGVWGATDKAIAANLADRKPVSTASSSQQDQLLWSADIIAILKEHVLAGSIN